MEKLNWRKSRRSQGNSNCVEVAVTPDGGRAVRNSKKPDGAVVFYTKDEWAAFIGGVKDGEFDE